MDQFTNLPTSIKLVLGVLSAGLVGAIAFIVDRRALPILLIGLLIVIVLFCLYLLVLRIMRKRQAARMGSEMAQHSTVAPRTLSDPNQRAMLDKLRQNFQRGVDKFRAAGKDLYKLPWYVVVGEPGSGKTEAIRHCNVGFPPGMQDELQGAGGTINMNWWFTNHAVLLDTAGRLMFEEVAPGSTSEWREFLALLKRSRPNCPINGLVLVVPADSLIKDSADAIAKKASRIAQQFNTIQGALDVRFPVFVLITKTDLINGFREFFEHIKDPQLQHQMLGWSNPGGLDEPFRPELVDQHLQHVVARIRRRRLGLLQDPTPRGEVSSSSTATPWSAPAETNQAPRRLDEVDSLFSLPTSIGLLAPRLRRYLEMIFVPNEWSGKPLFLRGIYFTSAMREGTALDLDLAEAVGVPVDTLPDKAWARESAYFLRDLFLQKIFEERGLVTRATNTRTMLRRRQAILFGVGFAGLALVFAFSWIGSRSLRESVGRERAYWQAASEGWQDGNWRPIVSPEFKGGTNYIFNGDQEITVGDEKVKLADYHLKLAELAKSDIQIPWAFKLMGEWVAGANSKRKQAQRIVYEGGVVKPIVQAARAKVELSRDNWSPRASEALTFLVRLEGMIYSRSAGLTGEELSAASFFKPTGSFLWDNPKPNEALSNAFEWTYIKGGDGRGYWPPRWLSAGFSLDKNTSIAVGLTGFLKATLDSQKAQDIGFDHIKKLRGELQALRQAEVDLAKTAAQPGVTSDAMSAAFGAYLRQKTRVDQAMTEATQSGVFPPGPLQLFSSYKQLVEEARRQSDAAFKSLTSEIDRFAAAVQDNPKETPFTLPAEIRRRLLTVQQQLKQQAESSFPADELAELQALDKLFLEKTAAGEPLFVARTEIYQLALAQAMEPAGASTPLVGNFGKQVDQLRTGMTAAKERSDRYQGSYASEMNGVTRRLLDLAQSQRLEKLYERYLAEVETVLRGSVGFPLLNGSPRAMSAAELRAVDTVLRGVRSEMPSLRAGQPQRLVASIDLLESRLQKLSAISEALLNADGRPATVTVTLLNYADQRRSLLRQIGAEEFGAKFVGNLWRMIRVNNKPFRTEARANEELAKISAADAAFTVDFFRGVEDKEPDRTFTLKADWAALQLLQQGTARRQPGGKEWEITLAQKESDGSSAERYLILLLQFEKPLPEFEQWPTASRLGL
jgi:hypothetical protein